ncbi:MAG: OB-fold domain-containing protein [Acidimicrobiia bacterium]
MSTPVRIVSVGAAAPDLRLPAAAVAEAWGRGGGRGRVAVCGPDEDSLTLAAEAGTRAMTAAGCGPDTIDGLWWGTSTPPFADGPSHAVLAAALGLGANSGGALLAGSAHAGPEALLVAADAVLAGSARRALVVVSDAPLPGTGSGYEGRAGAGAAAVVLAAEGGSASLGVRVTRTAPLLDRYRGQTDAATRDLYDARLFREEIFLPVLLDVGRHLAPFEIGQWSLPDPDGRLAAAVAKQLGAPGPASAAVYGSLGDTGAAAALLGALPSFDAAGSVAVVGYGGGRATAVVVTVDAPVPGATGLAPLLAAGRDVSYTEALRARGQLVPAGETVAMGVPPESAMFVRGAHEMLELLGARCVECGTVNTPPSIHPVCIACGAAKFELVGLARHGVVHTFVVNQTMPAPFVAPLPIAVIDLDDGARVMLQVIGPAPELAIGTEVELTLRRYAYERAVPVYGYKARPLPAGE